MSVEAGVAPSFSCAGCGREFRWKQSIAGKAAKCGCGASVKVPETEPGKQAGGEGEEESFFSGLEAAVSSAPVVQRTPIPVADIAPAPRKAAPGKGGQAAVKTSKNPLYYQRGAVSPTQEELDRARNMSTWGEKQDRIAPGILLGVSFAIFLGACGFSREASGPHANSFMLFMLIYSIVCSIGLVAGAFVTASVAGMSFGLMGLAILRLSAISYACVAVNQIFDALRIPFTGFINAAINYGIFTFGLMGFFEFDYTETRILAIVSMITKFIVTVVAFIILGVIIAAAS